MLGRGPVTESGDPPKAEFFRQRPGVNEPTGALEASTVSRRQWLLTPEGSTIRVENVGKPKLSHNGHSASACVARPGDTLGIEGIALFLVVERARILPKFEHTPFDFGEADAFGIVGESEAAWRLRYELVELARSNAHVLVFGASGSGKELCARALHLGSSRVNRDFVSRSAATLPSGIIEAELFGNAANYPNSGMPARSGLIGAADGGTLFIDELGELPEREQSTLLRVLDAGEYQRLGEERVRKSDLRVVAATNRAADSLKFDLLARFPEHLHVPDLNARRADIPLIANGILRRLSDESHGERGVVASFGLIDVLVRHLYSTNVRELEHLLRSARRETRGPELRVTPALETQLLLPSSSVDISPDEIRLALSESRSVGEAAKRLGLPSRFALHRLMKKLGVTGVASG
jgi:two-component system nitrogen regulation response regulator GlnG/two-component system response regulator HydG